MISVEDHQRRSASYASLRTQKGHEVLLYTTPCPFQECIPYNRIHLPQVQSVHDHQNSPEMCQYVAAYSDSPVRDSSHSRELNIHMCTGKYIMFHHRSPLLLVEFQQ